MLEPYEGKLSRTVLRGERGSNALDLPDTLPDKWFAKTIIRGLKLSAVANNVCFLYNNLPGFDPECTYSTGNGQGIETASLPSTRSFGFNLNVTF